ncbi:MAG TPA: hypothetical protein VFN55_14730, partial [Solirubrobacteraceae bacterium]|nr:hypothetical protein [Solirubrobacteraceae bacterium]
LIDGGRRDEAVHSRRAIEIYSQLGDPEREARVTINLGAVAYEEGRWDDAIDLYRRGAELSRRGGNLDVAATGELNIGEILSDQGRLSEAMTTLTHARRVYTSIGQKHGAAFATMLLGRLAVREGRYEDGRALLEEAGDGLSSLNLAIYVGAAKAYLAEGEALGGDPSTALAMADRLLSLDNRNVALLRRVRAIALIRLGRSDPAVGELERSLEAASFSGTDYDTAAALDLLVALGVLVSGVEERDAILERLHVGWLPRPAALVGAAERDMFSRAIA